MKLAGGIAGGVFVKDYSVYKKMDQRVIQQQKFYGPIKDNKITSLHGVCLYVISHLSKP